MNITLELIIEEHFILFFFVIPNKDTIDSHHLHSMTEPIMPQKLCPHDILRKCIVSNAICQVVVNDMP